MDTLHRQWTMLQSIPRYPRKIAATDLRQVLSTEGFDIDLRSVQRDLKKLSIPFPLVADENKPAGWSWAKDAESFDLPGMDPTTALTFSMVDRFLAKLLPQSSMTSLTPQVRRAESVLTNMSGGDIRSWPDKVRSISRSQPLLPARIEPEVMEVITEALLRNQRFSGNYRNRSGKERNRDFSPLGLIYADQVIYLVAQVPDHDQPRAFALHRFSSAELKTETFTPPPGFNLDDFLASRPLGFPVGDGGTIKLQVRFHGDAAMHLQETPLSPDQQTTKESDDTIVIEATVADTRQLRWWLLGFGETAEIIAPEHLRQEIVETVHNMGKRYGI